MYAAWSADWPSCWSRGIRASDSNKLNKLIMKTCSVLEISLEPLGHVVESRMLHKHLSSKNGSPPPRYTLVIQRRTFSERLLQLQWRSDGEQYCRSLHLLLTLSTRIAVIHVFYTTVLSLCTLYSPPLSFFVQNSCPALYIVILLQAEGFMV